MTRVTKTRKTIPTIIVKGIADLHRSIDIHSKLMMEVRSAAIDDPFLEPPR
jgi:hypothetical protein